MNILLQQPDKSETAVKMDIKTTRNHLRIFRRAVVLWLQNLGIEARAIGGEGWIIEIDESCATKKLKYGRGTGGNREERWLFGMVERKRNGIKGRFVIFPVPNRQRMTLFRIINTYVRPGKFHVHINLYTQTHSKFKQKFKHCKIPRNNHHV